MDISETLLELQAAADHRKARRLLRSFGWPSLIVGVLNAFVGYSVVQESVFGVLILLVAAWQIGVGLLNITMPMPVGIILDGLGFVAVGALNLLSFALLAMVGDPETARSLIYGLIGCGYGIYRFISYPRFAHELSHKPEPEDVKRLDDMVKEIQKAKLKDSPDLIAFQTSRFFASNNQWRGRLAGSAGMFVDQRGHVVLVAPKDEVTIDVTGKVLLGKTLKANIRIHGRTFSGTIEPPSFEKYEQWKEGDNVEFEGDAEETEAT